MVSIQTMIHKSNVQVCRVDTGSINKRLHTNLIQNSCKNSKFIKSRRTKQGKIKRQTHSCDCQTTTNPLIKSTDFYFNINCTKLKIDTIGIDACIEEIRKKRLFPKTGAGGDKRKTMKETISSLHLEIESLKEQLRHQREHFEQQHENQLTVTRNQSHELAHKNTQLSMKDAEINDKNIEIKGIKRALETRCTQTRNAERNNVNLMNANSDLAKKLEESEKINKKLRENTDHGQTVEDVGVDSSAGVMPPVAYYWQKKPII